MQDRNRNRRRDWKWPVRMAVLAGVLITAQIVAAGHYDFDAGEPGSDGCAVCTVLNVLGSANLSAPVAALPLAPDVPSFELPGSAPVTPNPDRYLARGPPPAS